MIGYVQHIVRDRGFGFISVDGEPDNYYFRNDDLSNCNLRQLEEGDVVEFDPWRNSRGKQAANVRKKYKAEPEANIPNPGIHPMVKLEHFNEDERRIIAALGKVFYVTHGGNKFQIGGNANYKYCLIKPTDYFVQTFKLSRELVVILSDYVNFEPRTLDAAAHVYCTIPSEFRLDKGCYILFSHDDQIESKLTDHLKDNNMTQIVIPFTYSEALADTYGANKIQERFRKYLFDTDLFSTTKPIDDDMFFFGRRDLVQDIVTKCKNNTNCGVFGLRRSGKTSVLYAVKRMLHQQNYPTVFIPCQSDLSSLDWRSALHKVVKNVAAALGKDPEAIDSSVYQTWETVTYFERDMDAILKDTSLPVTIMFDEIEAITFSVPQGEESENLWVDGTSFIYFWNAIRGYCSKYPQKLSILVAGTNPMINEEAAIGKKKQENPMYGQLSASNQGAYLQAFRQEDTKNMVDKLGGYMGITFDEYCIGRLTSDCGGHPFLIRILCSYINRYVRANDIERPVVIKQPIYDSTMPEFERSSDAAGFFWMILNILMTSYPREFETLKLLALQGDETVSRIQSQAALAHLIGYGLIECNHSHYAIKYNVITHFLRGEYRFERLGLTIEEQKAEIQLRVNAAEMQLRKLVKNTLLMFKGATNARDVVISAMKSNGNITPQNLHRAHNLDYSQLFDASVNNMYFSLLVIIICNNYPLFANIFEDNELTEVENHLWEINTDRRCPDHSYTEDAEKWSWKKFEDFRNSMS